MKCKCRAKPAPVVTWFKDSTQVSESARFKMKCTSLEGDIYELVLQIKVNKNDMVIRFRLHRIIHTWKWLSFDLGSVQSRWWTLQVPR